jgi:ABC-type histidine transport system ATPase subunit
MSLLRVDDVYKAYGDLLVLKGVSFPLDPQERGKARY